MAGASTWNDAPRLVAGTPPSGIGGPFEQPSYVRACAVHEGAESCALEAGGLSIALLREPEGALHTVYGYPVPYGDGDIDALAAALSGIANPVRVALSPIGPGADLAGALARRLAPVSSRPISVTALDDDPLAVFQPRAKGAVRRAQAAGVAVDVGELAPWFGPFYRATMEAMQASPLYRFGDRYFELLAEVPNVLVSVRDGAGVAVAALFIAHGDTASYHLAARRAQPEPPPGTANLAVLEGLREVRKVGARTAILGGGRAPDADDPLLRFKRSMATDVLPRPTFVVGART
jgi:hypothetical protein